MEPELETELKQRFEVRVELFVHGFFCVELCLPASAEALIDESEFNTDERLPYWAELWPSARALARHLLDDPPREERIVELGAGVALPSLVLCSRGAGVLATDYYADALRFAEANAARNALPKLATALVDWRAPPPGLGRFNLILAADVLYEARNVDALVAAIPRLLRPGGRALLADPGRVYLGEFRGRMIRAGWRITEHTREEAAPNADPKQVSRVRILELRRAG